MDNMSSACAGFAAGVYSGLTYGLREAQGVHDWVHFPISVYLYAF